MNNKQEVLNKIKEIKQVLLDLDVDTVIKQETNLYPTIGSVDIKFELKFETDREEV